MLGTIDAVEKINVEWFSELQCQIGAWCFGGVYGKRARNIMRESFRIGIKKTYEEEKQRVMDLAEPDIRRRAATVQRHNNEINAKRRAKEEAAEERHRYMIENYDRWQQGEYIRKQKLAA